MSKSYNDHGKNYWGQTDDMKRDSNTNRRAHQKRLIENIKKAVDENIEEVAEHFEGGKYEEITGADPWCYD